MTSIEVLAMLVRRRVITLDPDEAEACCGLERDEDGFCSHKGKNHPIFVDLGSTLDTVASSD